MIDRLGIDGRKVRLAEVITLRDAFERIQLNDRDAFLYDALKLWTERETQFLFGEAVPA